MACQNIVVLGYKRYQCRVKVAPGLRVDLPTNVKIALYHMIEQCTGAFPKLYFI